MMRRHLKKRLGSQTEPDDLKEKEKKLEKLQSEKQEAITAQDFEKAAKIRDEEKVLTEEVEKLKSSWKGTGSSSGLVVDEDDIADILGRLDSYSCRKIERGRNGEIKES